jgi:hypothetical protein
MELTLNLVWVCVVIVAIFVQIATLSRSATSSERPANHCWKIVAMGCALVILFFVISMTDDLHDQEILVEERRASRIAVGTETLAHHASARSIPTDFLLFFPRTSFSLACPAIRRQVEPNEFLFAAAIESENLSGRAPPVSLP